MMNPYAVLGVPENASEAQIKDAYRALARKYQDDTLQGGPLADIARQKMAELDAAYDAAVGALRGQAPTGRADYTYTDGVLTLPASGAAATLGVPAASIVQDAATGAVTVTPGETTVVVTGTV